jgi:hypothetical protein
MKADILKEFREHFGDNPKVLLFVLQTYDKAYLEGKKNILDNFLLHLIKVRKQNKIYD